MESLPHEIKLLVLEYAAANSFKDFLSLGTANSTFFSLYCSQAITVLDKILTATVGGSPVYRTIALELGQREDLTPRTISTAGLKASFDLIAQTPSAQFERKTFLRAIARFRLVEGNAELVNAGYSALGLKYPALINGALIELYRSLAAGPPMKRKSAVPKEEKNQRRAENNSINELVKMQLGVGQPGMTVDHPAYWSLAAVRTSRTERCVDAVFQSMFDRRFKDGREYSGERFHLGTSFEGGQKLFSFSKRYFGYLDRALADVMPYLDWRDVYLANAAVTAMEDACPDDVMHIGSRIFRVELVREDVLNSLPLDVRNKFQDAVEAMRRTIRRNLGELRRRNIILRLTARSHDMLN